MSSVAAHPDGSRRVLDVSKLPASAMDYRSPVWWGNALLLCIETSMFAIVIAAYFYFRRNFELWPPPKVDVFPPIQRPLPRLMPATLDLGLMLFSLIPMYIAERACLKMQERRVRIYAGIGFLIGVVCIVLRFYEFPRLVVWYDENAYGSIVWTLLGVHLMHLVIMTFEDGLMAVWIWTKGLDDKHARDIRVTTVYWYWVVILWVIVYAVVYLYPRWIG
jgi:cytochrome c oxidase subunit 1/cytochrome c oxidase subunit I+III